MTKSELDALAQRVSTEVMQSSSDLLAGAVADAFRPSEPGKPFTAADVAASSAVLLARLLPTLSAKICVGILEELGIVSLQEPEP